MKFKISRTSIWDFEHTWDVKKIHQRAYREWKLEFIDIEDLEDLVEFSKECYIILDWESIEIYDYYRE